MPYRKVAICAKKHSPSRLLLSQCLKNYPCVIFDFSLGILIEKTEPQIIPRSRPSGSTSKRTLALSFQSRYLRKILKLHLEKFSKHFDRTIREGKDHSASDGKMFFDQKIFFHFFPRFSHFFYFFPLQKHYYFYEKT